VSAATPVLAAELWVAQNIAFYVIGAIMVVSAVRVVTVKNMVHAALWLVIVLAGIAAQFILLAAEFTAITQILVYIGAIVVLFLFGIMLTRAPMGASDQLDNGPVARAAAAVVGLVLAVVVGYALWDGFRDREFGEMAVQTTAQVSDSIFSTYLVPFEAVSVLLLAALIGAIVLARRD
jgi:NADH-quinone oxidoreductase subunit J